MKIESQPHTPANLANLANLAKQECSTLDDLMDKTLSEARGKTKPKAEARVLTLHIDTRKRLENVVKRLTADCIRFYRDDQDILDQMSTEALEDAVLEYLSKRDWYRRGLIEETKS